MLDYQLNHFERGFRVTLSQQGCSRIWTWAEGSPSSQAQSTIASFSITCISTDLPISFPSFTIVSGFHSLMTMSRFDVSESSDLSRVRYDLRTP